MEELLNSTPAALSLESSVLEFAAPASGCLSTSKMGDLSFILAGISNAERMARCRELRALALVYCGLMHPATTALAAAATDPAMVDRALGEINALPALRRRRLLAAYAALTHRGR